MRQWRIGSMEGGRTINLKKLTMEELAGVVNLYPWFAGARKELCERMAALGGESWGVSQYADQAMYVAEHHCRNNAVFGCPGLFGQQS